MKKINTALLTLFASSVLCFSACKNDQGQTKIKPTVKAPSENIAKTNADILVSSNSYNHKSSNLDQADGATPIVKNSTKLYMVSDEENDQPLSKTIAPWNEFKPKKQYIVSDEENDKPLSKKLDTTMILKP